MWPFAADPIRLEAIDGPTAIDVVTRVVSPNDVASPVSGFRAAFVQLEAFERVTIAPERTVGLGEGPRQELIALGAVILGDLVRLEIDGPAATIIELPVRRATLRLAREEAGVTPVHAAVPELVPLLARAKRGGTLCVREHLALHRDRLRLRATVERVTQVSASGYRSGVTTALVIRDDLAPVLLDEVLDAPAF